MRCDWARGPWLIPYHDMEWGEPVHDDRRHFELLVMEGAQAGLSWLTVLKRRAAYRRAFAGFDPEIVANFDSQEVEAALADPGIVRHRQKVESAVGNAAAVLRVQDEYGSFDAFVWTFVGGCSIATGWAESGQVPATVPAAVSLSNELRTRGFRFVGPTICYSYMQAAGLVNDHLRGCFRFHEVQTESIEGARLPGGLAQSSPLAAQ